MEKGLLGLEGKKAFKGLIRRYVHQMIFFQDAFWGEILFQKSLVEKALNGKKVF